MPSSGHTVPERDPNRTRTLLLLGLITLLGLVLRLYRLEARDAWFDELFTIVHASKPLGTMMNVLIRDLVHPPLHYLLVHAWFRTIGFGAWHARMISVLCGAAAVPMLYPVTRRFTGAGTALLACLLLAVSQYGVYYSQEARDYELALLFSVVSAWMFLRFLERPTIARFAVFTVAGSALVYSHYFGAATLAGFGIYMLLYYRHRPRLVAAVAAAGLLMAVSMAPWFYELVSTGALASRGVGGLQPEFQPHWYSVFDAMHRMANGKLSGVNAPMSWYHLLLAVGLFSIPFVGLIVFRERTGKFLTSRPGKGLVLALGMALLPFLLAAGAGYGGMIFQPRHYSFGVAGFCMAAAIAATYGLPGSRFRILWIASVLLLSAGGLHAVYTDEGEAHYREAFAPMAAEFQPGDCLISGPIYFFANPHYGWTANYRDVGEPRPIERETLPKGASHCSRLWLAWDETDWMNVGKDRTYTLNKIESTFRQVGTYSSQWMDLRLYVPREPADK